MSKVGFVASGWALMLAVMERGRVVVPYWLVGYFGASGGGVEGLSAFESFAKSRQLVT